ncbi:GxxExxY protein [Stieleria tagensis]|uniref:GxxExxY protein n=1 Tax=Stieleria tagensis TaxID=2956795 RepID=UPI0028F44592|nr:GxxExxY protein [Stieleria tagensis]
MCGDHLPRCRMDEIFIRSGLKMSRSSPCEWMWRISDLMQPHMAQVWKSSAMRFAKAPGRSVAGVATDEHGSTQMNNDELNTLTKQVIGCAFQVSNTLGSGFWEKVYRL